MYVIHQGVRELKYNAKH